MLKLMPALMCYGSVRAILDRSFIGEIPSAQQQAYGAAHGLVAAFNDPYTLFVEPAPRRWSGMSWRVILAVSALI